MEQIHYNPAYDIQPEDRFAPTTENALRLPKEVKVKFIGSEQDVAHLQSLVGKPYIGMDVEWRPNIMPFEKTRPALL
jgi:hypothetical protein